MSNAYEVDIFVTPTRDDLPELCAEFLRGREQVELLGDEVQVTAFVNKLANFLKLAHRIERSVNQSKVLAIDLGPKSFELGQIVKDYAVTVIVAEGIEDHDTLCITNQIEGLDRLARPRLAYDYFDVRFLHFLLSFLSLLL